MKTAVLTSFLLAAALSSTDAAVHKVHGHKHKHSHHDKHASTPVSTGGKFTVPISKKELPLSRRERIIGNTLGVRARYGYGPQKNSKMLGADGGNSTNLIDYSDDLYTAPITLGNGQAFTVDLDTGSSDVWVRGPSCFSLDGSCGAAGQATVNIKDTTIKSTGKKWTTQYGSGGVSGNIYLGPVSLAGAQATIDFGVSTSETGFNSPGDGLLGLGFASISEIGSQGLQQSNFIDELNLDDNIFSFYLSDSADGDDGEVTIGGYDSSKFTGTLQYVPLNAETYWQFDVSDGTYSVGSAKGSLATSTYNAIADTGTTLLILDTPAANAINKAIGATYDSSQGAYFFSSCTPSSTPDITITFGGIPFTITSKQYILDAGNGECISGITQGASSAGVQIFGDTFLRAYYSVYDKAQSRLGFAKAKHGSASSTSETAVCTPRRVFDSIVGDDCQAGQTVCAYLPGKQQCCLAGENCIPNVGCRC